MAMMRNFRLDIPIESISMAALVVVACATVGNRSSRRNEAVSRPEVQEYVDRYLGDSQTPEAFKEAISRGVAVEGMCPFQVFAAAGLPGPYMVKKDPERWTDDVPPPVVVEAQCSHPDDSVVELMFRNRTQFAGEKAEVFRIRFVRGKVTNIDRTRAP